MSRLYLDMIKELIEMQKSLFEKVENGDYSEVCYLEKKDKEWGICDKNYFNRLRLAYYMLFKNMDKEQIVERLFEEELKDRETNDFQGIGSSLQVLSFLLLKYNDKNKYQELFYRARNANFDCACGYDEEDLEVQTKLDEFDLYDCIDVAIEMNSIEYAKKLVELWKKGIKDWNEQTCRELVCFNKKIKNEVENEEALKKLLACALKKGEAVDRISAWKNLIAYYIQFYKYEQAYQEFTLMIGTAYFPEIYGINLFHYILEICMELICNFPKKADDLWSWAKPFLMERSENLHGNLYKKSIEAANCVKDESAEELAEKYRQWKKRVGFVDGCQ